MKIQKKIITRDLAFSIDIQTDNSKTHSIVDTFPNVFEDIIRDGIGLMENRFKVLETIIKHNDEIEKEKRELNR